MRLGDLDKLKKEFDFIADKYGIGEKKYISIKDIEMIIDKTPTFDVTKNQAYDQGFITAMKLYARQKGEWIRTGSLGNGNAQYECSNCHYGDEHAESQEVPYCWHCGSDMRKGGAK